MRKRTSELTKNIASSRNWFRAELLPTPAILQRQILSIPSPIQNYDGVKLLFVEDGSGTLVANGKQYSLDTGTCCLLYFFHFHKILPSPGTTLKLSICQISINTFLFASIVPGCHLIEIEQSTTPILANFSESQQFRIRQILIAMENDSSGIGNDMQYALLFEWLGRLCREFKRTHEPSDR